MDSRKARPTDRHARARLLRAFKKQGWREVKLEERIDHAGDGLGGGRPGRAVAFERAANERPERLAVTNETAPAESHNPAENLEEALDVVGGLLNGDARELGWALVGLDWRYESEEPAPTGYTLYATFAPLGRQLGKGARGGHKQISDDTVLEILILRGEGMGARRIANELNDRGVRPPRSKAWGPSTVQAVLKSDYAYQLAAQIEDQGPGAFR